jgi:hypothetical protein
MGALLTASPCLPAAPDPDPLEKLVRLGEKAPATPKDFYDLLERLERVGGAAIKRVRSEAVEGEAVELPSTEQPNSPKQSSDSA